MTKICVGGITWPKCAHAQSQVWAVKNDLRHPCYSFLLYTRAAIAWTKKKRSLRNGKLKANRPSETEEQRKERLREKYKSTRITKNYKRKRNGRQKQKTMRNSTLKRLKRSVVEEKKQRLEKLLLTNTSGWPWRQKKKKEQDWRMMQLPNGSVWPCRRTKKEEARLKKIVATTQLRLALETEEERRAKIIGFN